MRSGIGTYTAAQENEQMTELRIKRLGYWWSL